MMDSNLTISFCEDVKTFLLSQLMPLLHPGQCLVHLGCHQGDLAYELQSIVGSAGRIIGLESKTDSIYSIFKVHQDRLQDAEWDNLFFFHGNGKDLRTDQYRLSSMLKNQTIQSFEQWQALAQRIDRYFDANPVLDSNSVDVLLITEYITELTQTALITLATEVSRTLKAQSQLVLLLPAGKAQKHRVSIDTFIFTLARFGVIAEKIVDHFVTSGCCDEDHYLLLTFRTSADVVMTTTLTMDRLTQFLEHSSSPKNSQQTCLPTSGCC